MEATPLSPRAAAWAPLGIRVFRLLWLAVLVSNMGTWMQTVGAQWLLVGLPIDIKPPRPCRHLKPRNPFTT